MRGESQNGNASHPIIELGTTVAQYKANMNSFDGAALQDIRDKIALNLYYCADFYSSVRTDMERADYDRKRAVAKEVESLRGEMNPKTGRKLTQGEIENLARINTEEYEENAVKQNQRYYKTRLIIDSSNHILNSISSRLNMLKH